MGILSRPFRITRSSMRCGDLLFLISLIIVLLFMVSLLLRSPEPVRQRRNHEVVDSLWPRGKMREVDDEATHDHAAKKNKRLSKINAAVEKLGLGPIPDNRPKECHDHFGHGGKKPDLTQIASRHPEMKIHVVIVPSEASFSVSTFKTTMVSLLATTAPIYQQMSIVVVTNNLATTAQLAQTFDNIPNPKKPHFRVVERRQLFKKETLFKELLSITTEFSENDVAVFITSGMQVNVGWLEALMDPLLEKSKNSPIISMPSFTELSSSDSRLMFNWRLAPNWSEHSPKRENAVDPIPSLLFMPQAFAIRRDSNKFDSFLSFCSQRNIADPTAFDAAMYIWRCLGSEIVVAPCSRVSLPHIMMETEFDPFMFNPSETKKRIAANWLDEYRNKFEEVLGQWPSLDNPTHCKSLSAVINADDEKQLFFVPEEYKLRTGYFYLSSEAGTTFLPSNRHMRAGTCPFPETPQTMFKHTLAGAIHTPTGLCLQAPARFGYVEVVQCLETEPSQKWTHRKDHKLQSEGSQLCIMHATDPDKGDPTDPKAQVLMMRECKGDDSNFSKFTFSKTC